VGRSVPGSRRLVLSLRPSSRCRWVGREGCPASCAHPQRVPLLPWCSNPSPSPRAPRSMPARVCTRLSLVRAVPSCAPISAAAPPLRLQGCKRFCISLFSSRLIAFESVPPAAPTAPPAHHPSRAGPAAAVWRPALAAPGGRHGALVSWGRPRAVTRGRPGGWAPAVAKAVPAPPQPRGRPGRCPGRAPAARAGGLLAPARAGPPRVWAPPGPPWQGRRQAGSVERVGRPQADKCTTGARPRERRWGGKLFRNGTEMIVWWPAPEVPGSHAAMLSAQQNAF
jgi:hypothetical protein